MHRGSTGALVPDIELTQADRRHHPPVFANVTRAGFRSGSRHDDPALRQAIPGLQGSLRKVAKHRSIPDA